MEIRSAKFVISNSQVVKCPSHDRPEYAFIGRSNVGKSSLINMLTGHKGLAMTSAKPGKTLLVNHFIVNDSWYLVDLPGYGYAQRGNAQRDRLTRLIEDYVLEREQLTSLFVLIDSRLEPQKIDLEFIEWLGENEVPFGIIFTKADKLGHGGLTENVKRFLDRLSEQWEQLPPHFITSSKDKSGRDDVLNYIDGINKSIFSLP